MPWIGVDFTEKSLVRHCFQIFENNASLRRHAKPPRRPFSAKIKSINHRQNADFVRRRNSLLDNETKKTYPTTKKTPHTPETTNQPWLVQRLVVLVPWEEEVRRLQPFRRQHNDNPERLVDDVACVQVGFFKKRQQYERCFHWIDWLTVFHAMILIHNFLSLTRTHFFPFLHCSIPIL